nr:FT-interacting protein 1-like [Tanacetum cinerariifolium]
ARDAGSCGREWGEVVGISWSGEDGGERDCKFGGSGGSSPMKTKDGRASTYAYCVAKYGTKWIRTRTIADNFAPKWNEQYTWEVFDPCTVTTIGVFDNCHLYRGDKAESAKDLRIDNQRWKFEGL